MLRYIIRRLLLMIPVLAGVIFIVFTINRMTPGDPVQAMLGASYTQEQYDITRERLGLDEPYIVQLFDYYKGIVTHFDLGTSYRTGRAVTTEIAERFEVTMVLGLIGVFITIIVGVPAGMISATRQYSVLDYGVTLSSMFFAAVPSFWLALMLMLVFSAKLGWLPASGISSWKSWIMPCLAVGLQPVAVVARMTRSSMLEVIRQDYIRTARAKGLSERMIIRRHALKNSLIPVITMIGIQIGTIIGGAVVIEAIFSIPGMGNLMMTAINNRDYPLVQGSVLVLSMSICLMNLIVDIVYGFVDPRIMAQYKRNKKRPAKTKGQIAEGQA